MKSSFEKLKCALDIANSLVVSHGIMSYMSEYDKKCLFSKSNNDSIYRSYDFCLNPNSSRYSSDNFCCSIELSYCEGKDYEHELGSVNRKYTRQLRIKHESSSFDLQKLSLRENFIKSLSMVCELLEMSLPSECDVVITTAEENADRKARAHEQQVGQAIFNTVGWNNMKNLRKGGRGRLVNIPDNLSTPLPGNYRFQHVRRRDRKGKIVDKADYFFRVSTIDGNSRVRIFRID